MTVLSPIGWVVRNGRGGGHALFLERPQADQFAVRVHGTVDALYSGAQLAEMLRLSTAAPAVGTAVLPNPETPHAAA